MLVQNITVLFRTKCVVRIVIFVALVTLSLTPPGHTDAFAQDRVPAATPPEEEINKLKVVVSDQQKRIEQLERTVAEQKKLIEQALHISAVATPEQPDKSLQPADHSDSASEQSPPAPPIRNRSSDDPSPLSIRIGKVSVTPYGFLDLTTIVRNKDIASGIATNFASIPFSNTVTGRLSELRFTAQNSRLGARFDAHHGGIDFIGMIETDFAGFTPGNIAVTTNSNGLRIRLGWLDFRKSKWEVLAGQSWSLLTPNRKGTSPLPADIFSTQNIDPAIQVGLTWARAPQFRVIYHANRTVTFAVSLETDDQYGGGSAGAGEITLPSALVSSYTPQLDLGHVAFEAPNLHPDVIAKVAFDPMVGRRDLHLEVAGLLSGFRFFNPQDQATHRVSGGGILVGLNYEASKNFRLIANGFYSNGGGRYIFGLAPDVIINADGKPSLLHSASTVTGFEYQLNARNLLDAYYGGAYIYRSRAIDTNGEFIGYGYPGSPLDHNRSLQQFTLGYTHTFWRDPNYGAFQLLGQYSYVVRHPWSVPSAEPSGAHVDYLYLSLRYVLPGAPPAKSEQ